MTLTKSKIKSFLNKWVGKEDGYKIMSGKEGQLYSEYSSGKWYISFDGSALYELFEGYPNFKFVDSFMNFLSGYGYWFERGNSWNCNIYKN